MRGAKTSRPRRRGAALALLAVAAALAGPAALWSAPEEGAGPGGGRIAIRPAELPEEETRERVERWHRRWTEATAPLAGLLDAFDPPDGDGGGGADPGAPVADRAWCRGLARELLALDRERALPVPVYAADLHVRRALDRLMAGAVACLEGRYHASAHHVGRALDRFGEAAFVLRPYGVEP